MSIEQKDHNKIGHYLHSKKTVRCYIEYGQHGIRFSLIKILARFFSVNFQNYGRRPCDKACGKRLTDHGAIIDLVLLPLGQRSRGVIRGARLTIESNGLRPGLFFGSKAHSNGHVVGDNVCRAPLALADTESSALHCCFSQ